MCRLEESSPENYLSQKTDLTYSTETDYLLGKMVAAIAIPPYTTSFGEYGKLQ